MMVRIGSANREDIMRIVHRPAIAARAGATSAARPGALSAAPSAALSAALSRILLAAFLAALAPAAALGEDAPAAPAPAPGVWQEQDLVFDYMGFTEHYTCDGLRQKLMIVLRALGARSDFQANEWGCSDGLRPNMEKFPATHLKFASLAPAGAAGAAAGASPPATGATVNGAWKTVNLIGPRFLDTDECELVEQIAHDLLPHFTVRNVPKPSSCVPHSRSVNFQWQLEVFVPQDHVAGG
jgi:hypothetical protein